MNYEDTFEDIITHANDFKEAMVLAIENSNVSSDPDYRRAQSDYWHKQIATYERIEMMAKLMTGRDTFEPAGETSRERFFSIVAHASEKVEAFSSFMRTEVNRYALKNLNGAEVSALALADFHAQVCNGGITQYIYNGCSSEGVVAHLDASMNVKRLCVAFSDSDQEVSNLVAEMARFAHRHRDLENYSESRYANVENDAEPLERKYYALDDDRLFGFYMSILDGIDPACSPFFSEIVKKEEALAPSL